MLSDMMFIACGATLVAGLATEVAAVYNRSIIMAFVGTGFLLIAVSTFSFGYVYTHSRIDLAGTPVAQLQGWALLPAIALFIVALLLKVSRVSNGRVEAHTDESN